MEHVRGGTLFPARLHRGGAGALLPVRCGPGHAGLARRWELLPGQTLLDLGCGAGLVGIAAAKVLGEGAVVLTDVDPAAVACARENAARNGVAGVRIVQGDALEAVDATGFDWILSNPPYHADFPCPSGSSKRASTV